MIGLSLLLWARRSRTAAEGQSEQRQQLDQGEDGQEAQQAAGSGAREQASGPATGPSLRLQVGERPPGGSSSSR